MPVRLGCNDHRSLDVTLSGDTPLQFAYLVLHDEEFAREIAPRVDAEDFPQGALRGLTMLAKDQAERFGRSTTQQTLDAALEAGFSCDRYGTDPDTMRSVYDDLTAYEPDDESYDRIVEQAKAWLRYRHMRRAADQAQEHLDKGNTEAAVEALDLLARERAPVTEPPLTLSDVSVLYAEANNNGAIPTGFEFIDTVWEGGLHAHEFGVVVAVTSAGKTMSLCHLACEAYRSNHTVLYYSSELTPRQILGRIVSGLLEKPFEQLPEGETMRLLAAFKQRNELTAGIFIRGMPPGMTPQNLRHDLEQMERDGSPVDVVLLDSADDLTPDTRINEDWRSQAEIYWKVRQLAVNDGYAVWTSTQAKQEAVEKSKVGLKHMGRSFAKAQRAHVVVALSQTEGQRDDPLGPLISVRVIKDSEHGTVGRWSELQATFGKGRGFPGFRKVS